MTKLLIIGTFILSGLTGQAQDLLGVKSITQYEDTTIRKISSLDTNGNVTFWMNNRMNGPVIMLGASTYDSLGRRVMSISAHSNVGFSVYTYEFDSSGNESRVFSSKEAPEEDKEYRFNPYAHIDNYITTQELENDTTVQSIINNGEKHLVFDRIFDNNGNEIKEILFKENGDTSQITTNEYDKNANRVQFHFRGNLGEWDYHYSFDTNGNKLSSKRINSNGVTSDVHIYKYDDDNNLIEHQSLKQGKIQYFLKYLYLNGQKINEVYYYEEKLMREHTFEYDEKGNIIKESKHVLDDNKTTVYLWKYEFTNIK